MVNLGDKVTDRVSGLTGIVVARTEWMYGCVRCLVQPQEVKDGKPVESTSVDEPQLDVLLAGAVKDFPNWREPVAPRAHRPAGPRPEAQQRPTPRRTG